MSTRPRRTTSIPSTVSSFGAPGNPLVKKVTEWPDAARYLAYSHGCMSPPEAPGFFQSRVTMNKIFN